LLGPQQQHQQQPQQWQHQQPLQQLLLLEALPPTVALSQLQPHQQYLLEAPHCPAAAAADPMRLHMTALQEPSYPA
jgi:hypothetical protein